MRSLGKLSLSCDVIVVNHLIIRLLYLNERISNSNHQIGKLPQTSHHMIVFSLPLAPAFRNRRSRSHKTQTRLVSNKQHTKQHTYTTHKTQTRPVTNKQHIVCKRIPRARLLENRRGGDQGFMFLSLSLSLYIYIYMYIYIYIHTCIHAYMYYMSNTHGRSRARPGSSGPPRRLRTIMFLCIVYRGRNGGFCIWISV